MTLADVVAAMAAAGCSAQQIAAASGHLGAIGSSRSVANRKAYEKRRLLKSATETTESVLNSVAETTENPPEPRVGAFSIGEEVLIKEIPSVSRKTEPKAKRDPAEADATVEQFVDAYDRLASSVALPRCRVITDKRKSHVLARCRDLVSHFDYPSLQAGIDGFFNKVRGSPFLCGAGSGRKWKADLDWLINESNFVKVLEGYYEKAPGANGHNVFAFGR